MMMNEWTHPPDDALIIHHHQCLLLMPLLLDGLVSLNVTIIISRQLLYIHHHQMRGAEAPSFGRIDPAIRQDPYAAGRHRHNKAITTSI